MPERENHGTALSKVSTGKLLVIGGGKPRVKPAAVVTQRDLEEIIYFKRKMREATEQWKAKHDSICAALASGASVEEGVHTAAIAVNVVVR